MRNYKILVKGMFQKMAGFEESLNKEYKNGWRTVNITSDSSGRLIALLERMN